MSKSRAAKMVDPPNYNNADRAKRFDALLKQTARYNQLVEAEKVRASSGTSDSENHPPDINQNVEGQKQHYKKKGHADEPLTSNEIYLEVTPHYIKNGEMRDYQLRGLNWMISLMDKGINGILADEMGLGKTLQTISLLGYIKHFRNKGGPHIVVVPKSTLQNWLNEFERWCPSLKVISLIGDKKQRPVHIANVVMGSRWNVCVTTYEMCVLESATFRKFSWHYLVVDEAHRIKNEATQLAEMLRSYKSAKRLLLTGTPLQNNLHELWSLLNFLLPDVFNSSEDFDAWFNTHSICGGEDETLVTRLHTILKPFMLRRIKAEVEKSLLPKKEIKIYVGLSKMQRQWYAKVLLKDVDILTQQGVMAKMRIQAILIHLRKVCNHPYLFDGAEDGPPYDPDLTHLVQNSGKMVILDKLLAHLKANGSRVLIFSQLKGMLNILEDYCNWRGYLHHRLDGNTDHDERSKMIAEFNSDNSPTFCFLLSTRAGGLGINLATADSVIIYDSDWNPQADLQAIDRAHRIGQKKQVRVFRLVTEDTVDEMIIERGDIKLRLDRLVIQNGLVQQNKAGLNAFEMVAIARYGAHKIIESAESTVDTTTDIETILKRCELRTERNKRKLDELEEQGEPALRNFTLDMASETKQHFDSVYNFEGEDWLAKQKMLHEQNKNDNPTTSRSLRKHAVLPAPEFSLSDHQFFPPELKPLLQKEYAHKLRLVGDELPLTAREDRQKQRMLEMGFREWSRQDFNNFIQGLFQYERDDIEAIAECVPGKTVEEVTKYSCVFWDRYQEIDQISRTIEQIENNQAVRRSQKLIGQYLAAKVGSSDNPFEELRIQYPSDVDHSNFTEADDRILICTLAEIGLDAKNVYENVRARFLKSKLRSKSNRTKNRSVNEFHNRCSYLLSLIEAEMKMQPETAGNVEVKKEHYGSEMKRAEGELAADLNAGKRGRSEEQDNGDDDYDDLVAKKWRSE